MSTAGAVDAAPGHFGCLENGTSHQIAYPRRSVNDECRQDGGSAVAEESDRRMQHPIDVAYRQIRGIAIQRGRELLAAGHGQALQEVTFHQKVFGQGYRTVQRGWVNVLGPFVVTSDPSLGPVEHATIWVDADGNVYSQVGEDGVKIADGPLFGVAANQYEAVANRLRTMR